MADSQTLFDLFSQLVKLYKNDPSIWLLFQMAFIRHNVKPKSPCTQKDVFPLSFLITGIFLKIFLHEHGCLLEIQKMLVGHDLVKP